MEESSVPSGHPPFSPTIALLTLSRAAELEIARVLEPRGLTLRKYTILGHISGTPGLSAGELARRSGVSVPSVQTIVGGLDAAGLVRSVASASGHAAQLSATDAGSRLLDELRDEVRRLDEELFAPDAMRELSHALSVATVPDRQDPQD